ncbi:MAG: SPOR domain-containing protein [Saprospiraceae bacterium]|nr:SPOR domain-containing protein [Saprospiraceae bacterium]MCF8252673.1 SPOR domain-containing protein [Saprospiraceae bacterium]MCF8282872.1 SPOR domain-containing protein [Bacteroidales bacterium]MCF8314245.1 SPOR domain-containing protein [Saprospiraceae bacterium]MCF8443061.1 SPOR domain-containing protein [Saprospiraceae bacterium]
MKNPVILFIFTATLLAINVQAQDKLSWKKHLKLADELFAKAQYADAGEHYRAAFKQKTKKKELAYKAGNCFFTIRDYRNAAEAWKNVKDDNAAYPLIGLRYARCLKQNGEHEVASSEFVKFLGNYNGADKTAISQIVQTELRGCELAAQYTIKGDDPNIVLEHLSSNINTPETEFGPIPFSDEALYFSSTMAKRAEIYRSIRTAGSDWGKASPIDNFPVIEGDHFCNGALTPDASRFYFTICKSEEKWGGLTTHCEIFVTRRVGKTWTSPERLPDYINEQNVSTTQPSIVQNGNTEILYFASNRNGGMGGMDIWYTTREISSNANDFTLPINAGSRINTKGDEITPFYDKIEGNLYFASNGQLSIGGFDIFKTKGAKSQWQTAENVGTPLNSPADDFSFVKAPSGKGGFIVSNRSYGMDKVNTTDEDIFGFTYETPVVQYVARGEVFSKASREVLEDVEVAIYEIDDKGQRRFLKKVISANGHYDFAVEPSRKYALEANKDGFFATYYDFDSNDYNNYSDFGAPLYMEPYGVGSGDEGDSMKEDAQKMVVVEKVEMPKKEVVTKTTTTKAKAEASNAAPLTTGTYYKIQIIALKNVNLNHSRFGNVKNMRRIDKEFYSDRKLYRVMLADYATLEEAQADLPAIRSSNKDFSDAFIVEYKDGERGDTMKQ